MCMHTISMCTCMDVSGSVEHVDQKSVIHYNIIARNIYIDR